MIVQAMLNWFEYCGKVPSIEPLYGEDINALLVDEWIKHKAALKAMEGDCNDFEEESAYLAFCLLAYHGHSSFPVEPYLHLWSY